MNTDSLTATGEGSAQVERPAQDAAVQFEVGATEIWGRIEKGILTPLDNTTLPKERQIALCLVNRANAFDRLRGALQETLIDMEGWDAEGRRYPSIAKARAILKETEQL